MGHLGAYEDFNFLYEKLSSKWSNQLGKIIFRAGQFTQCWNLYETAGQRDPRETQSTSIRISDLILVNMIKEVSADSVFQSTGKYVAIEGFNIGREERT